MPRASDGAAPTSPGQLTARTRGVVAHSAERGNASPRQGGGASTHEAGGPHASRRAASAARCQRAGNPPGSPSRVRGEDHTEVSSARQLRPGRGCVPIGSPDCYIALHAVLRSLRLALWSVPPAGPALGVERTGQRLRWSRREPRRGMERQATLGAVAMGDESPNCGPMCQVPRPMHVRKQRQMQDPLHGPELNAPRPYLCAAGQVFPFAVRNRLTAFSNVQHMTWGNAGQPMRRVT
jgi:hypothetical protein